MTSSEDQPGGEPRFEPEELSAYLTQRKTPDLILQDYCAIGDSLSTKLGRAYWQEHGPEVFVRFEVPFGATSSGKLSVDAAEILSASLAGHASGGDQLAPVYVLELGAGSGLFAKLFLDHLAAQAPRIYRNLRYVVSDASPTMLAAAQELGLLAQHMDKLVFRTLRADPQWSAAPNLSEGGLPGVGGFHAIFANYLLDSLPFSFLALRSDRVWEMELRTGLHSKAKLGSYTSLSATEIRDLLEKPDEEGLRTLTGLYRALVFDSRFTPISRKRLPYAEAIPNHLSQKTVHFVHSHGPIACLKEALLAVRPDGFVFFNDYGFSDDESEDRPSIFQNFGGSVACGINVDQICGHFEAREGVTVVAPDKDPDNLYSRILTRNPSAALCAALDRHCGRTTWDAWQRPLREAREMVKRHAFEAARWKFNEVLVQQPNNWILLEEIAGLLVYQEEDYEAGTALVTHALSLNHRAPRLWNLLGDCLYGTNEGQKAEEAYRRAIEINPREVQGRLNLLYLLIDRRDYAQALRVLGEALACDEELEYKDQLLSKQDEILALIALQRKEELECEINRFRGHRALPSMND